MWFLPLDGDNAMSINEVTLNVSVSVTSSKDYLDNSSLTSDPEGGYF